MALPLTLRQLEYVVAIADHASFSRAAEACAVTQPALSAQIAQLEDTLGVQIFERDRRKVLVTPAGSEIVARARATLGAAGDVVDAAHSSAQPLTGPLRLGVIPTIAPFLLPAVLPAVREAYPKLRLVLREDQTARLLHQLDEGKLDAAVLALPVPGDLAAVRLYREEFALAVPRTHRLARRAIVRPADLDDEPLLLLDDGHCLRDQALAVCESAGAREQGELRATSLVTLVQMVASGLGVTLIPAMAAHALAPRGGEVVVVRFAPPAPGREVGLCWRMSSARGRELGALAACLRGPAEAHLQATALAPA
ncbi:MAG TPA: LysR substrate-binding domain-containing protein, partial [Kofleriaceae bacterium]|nr:LysR substrate-binding domain-containing protein [Kofleriaceae bacterium]